MLATQTLIDQALAQIRAGLPELEVELFPDTPTTYRLVHPLAAVLLAYPGSTFGEPRLIGRVEQERTQRLGTTLCLRHLWGEHGAAALLDRLRDSLVGWRPAEAEPVYAVGERLLHQEAGVWWYGADFAFKSRFTLPVRS